MRLALFTLTCALPLLAVDGVVVNVTTGKPQPGVAINLVQPSRSGMVPLGNVTSGAQGEFKIDKQIPPGPGLIQATYQGTTYNQIITPGMPTSGIQIKVYDSTKNASIAKTLEHLILIEPSIDNLKISETFVLGNPSNTTFNDPAKGSIQFYLPDSTGGKAQVVITAPGGMPITRPPVKTSPAGFYKIDYPVKPGETRMDVTYTCLPRISSPAKWWRRRPARTWCLHPRLHSPATASNPPARSPKRRRTFTISRGSTTTC